MILITAVDRRGGLLFNHRRLSQDLVLHEKILEQSRGSRLWMNAYSAKQFSDTEEILVDEDFLKKAGPGEYCFAEDQPCAPVLDRIEAVILFCWNRDYPADFFFDLDLRDGMWTLSGTERFAGSSHEEITKEVYQRVSEEV